MSVVNLSTERLRHVLKDIQTKGWDYRPCAAYDVIGPAGVPYITANTLLNFQHLKWFERRNPVPQEPTYIEVVFYHKDHLPTAGRPESSMLASMGAADLAAQHLDERRPQAQATARRVGRRAKEVADQAGRLHELLEPAITAEPLSGTARESLQVFGLRCQQFHEAVQQAIQEYLEGNTLVMDLILKYQPGVVAVKHGLNVAVLATEMATQTALDDSSREAYWGNEPSGAASTSEQDPAALQEALKMELAEVFLAGFMHDCGLWNNAGVQRDGHEAAGARLVAATDAIRTFAPAMVKIILFHSDVVRLADHAAAALWTEAENKARFKRRFYASGEEAEKALKRGGGRGELLTQADLRKILAVALSERYITQIQAPYSKPRWEVVNALARYADDNLYTRYLVVLCNSQVEVIAPPRAYVVLEGDMLVVRDVQGHHGRYLDVTGCEAGSIYHAGDKNSPHLITLFYKGDSGRVQAEYQSAQESQLWEGGHKPTLRIYLPAGRYRSSLSYKVTGFMGQATYQKTLGEYEREQEET